MTAMMRQVRRALDEHSVRRGRPILLAVRVPDSDGYRRAMGLDVEAWLAADIVDLFAVSDYWRMVPWESNVELARRYGKKVYACLSESRERDPVACGLRNSIESYRARVMQALAAGMDGIYLFNAQDVSNETLYHELGDVDILRALPKLYVSTARGVGNADFWVRDGVKRFLERDFVCPSRPRRLQAGESLELPLPVGDEAAGGSPPRFVLKLVFGDGGADGITVHWNDTALAVRAGTAPGEWLAEIERSVVRNGHNGCRVRAERTALLTDLLLWVFPAGTEMRLQADASLRQSIKERNELLSGARR